MFVADTAQSIYSTSWLVKGRSFTSIGFGYDRKKHIPCEKIIVQPHKIAEAAYSLIREDSDIVNDDNFVKNLHLLISRGFIRIFARYNTIGEGKFWEWKNF